jgi:hypothetical protein
MNAWNIAGLMCSGVKIEIKILRMSVQKSTTDRTTNIDRVTMSVHKSIKKAL